jgi:hypothetical protein
LSVLPTDQIAFGIKLPAAWGTAMKRPQFGLRLMLIVVTLVAAILGLRSAILSAQLKEQARLRDVELCRFKLQLDDVEKSLARQEAEPESDDPAIRKRNAISLRGTVHQIAWIKSEIIRLSK